ncbi:MAG: helix-hairpin-helix domain-containing protein [Bacteroidetes bacterium]|nr:helix-hairpin-helix domain-containing protein [Bacteroidota bacterium]
MNFLKKISEHFAFTKNEQKVFFFLSLVFFIGAGIKGYKYFIYEPEHQRFDYSQTDSIFNELSKAAANDSDAVVKIKINLNTAAKHELMRLPGVGEATAERILLYRTEKKNFSTIEDLKKIKGIGSKKFEKLKPFITVE